MHKKKRKSFMGDFAPQYVPESKLLVLGMVIPPSIGNPYDGYIKPLQYYWVDNHPYYI